MSGDGGGHAGGGHGKKHHGHDEEHEEHVNHEAWVIPYADMLTLLMAMFLVMWSTARIDEVKFAAVASALANEFGGDVPITGGVGVLGSTGATSGGSPVDFGLNASRSARAELALQREEQLQQALLQEENALAETRAQLEQELVASGLGDKVTFRQEERGLVVTIVSDEVLFGSGEALLMPVGQGLLDDLAEVLLALERPIEIEGHTDSRPIANNRYPSNWELSTSRATNVLRYLVDTWGFDPGSISAAGFADTRPIATNDTPDGQAKNRRVEVVILSSVK